MQKRKEYYILELVNFSTSSVAVLIIGMRVDWLGLEQAFKILTIVALGGIPFVFPVPYKKR